jgi:replicative DNA helicase
MSNAIELPKALESEKCVLGAALLDPASATLALASLCDPDFAAPAGRSVSPNRLVFQSMERLRKAGKPVDAAAVTDEMAAAKTLDDAGGPEYLLELGNSPISSENIVFYVKNIKDNSRCRDYLKTLGGVIERYSAEGAPDPSGFVAETAPLIAKAAAEGAGDGFQTSREVALDAIRAIHEEMRSGKGGLTGVDTGFPSLNSYTHGWQKGDLVVIAGRTSMGKSALAANLARASAKAGSSVAFFSFEMKSRQIMDRLISMDSLVDHERIRAGTMTQAELAKAEVSAAAIGGLPIVFDDSCTASLSDVASSCERAKSSDSGLGLVVIDYLNLMAGPHQESRQAEVALISRSLKQLARSLNVPVIALCQLNRDSEDNQSSIPTIANLRESGAIEQDADEIILLYRALYYETRKAGVDEPPIGAESLIFGKNRDGRLGTVELMFNRACQAFYEKARPSEAAASLYRKDDRKPIGAD